MCKNTLGKKRRSTVIICFTSFCIINVQLQLTTQGLAARVTVTSARLPIVEHMVRLVPTAPPKFWLSMKVCLFDYPCKVIAFNHLVLAVKVISVKFLMLAKICQFIYYRKVLLLANLCLLVSGQGLSIWF